MQNIDFDKLSIETLDRLTCFNPEDDSLDFILDQLKDGTLENGSETVYGTGRAGVRLSALDRNKTSKFSTNNGYVSMGAMAAQIGSAIESASATNKLAVPDLEYIKVTDATKVLLKHTPVGKTGAEIAFIYRAKSDNTQGEKFPISATVSTTAFSLDPATKTITLPTDVFEVGDIVIVPYDREVTSGFKMINSGENFSKSGRIVIDATASDPCNSSVKYHVVIVYRKAKIDGNFSLSFGNEPVVQAFSCEALQDICSTDKSLFEFYVA